MASFDSKKIATKEGAPFPLGVCPTHDGWNFAIYSETPIHSLMIQETSQDSPLISFPLNPHKHCSGDIWHICLELPFKRFYYGYQIITQTGPLILHDPYATLIESKNQWGQSRWYKLQKIEAPFALVSEPLPFDWGDDKRIQHVRKDLVIYEMHVRDFTYHPSSNVNYPGLFIGIIEKIPHLKELGITAIELLPTCEFDETEYNRTNPITGKTLYNYWGYSPLNFFSPMQRFTSSNYADEGAQEFKKMVKALHEAGIEVFLDVVFNHTGEGNAQGRTLSWKGFAENAYYLKNEENQFRNYTGCGNTLNCNHPAVSDLIIASLRHWVVEYHVDGFRFDLASIFTRGQDGKVLDLSPIIDRISQDPILSHCRLIAEPWDAAGLHQVGRFSQYSWSNQEQWMEWNDDFRCTVRCFLKGTPGFAGKFATKLCGSEDQYGKEGSPLNTINYIVSHDGFTLKDLVSYNHKHNEENDEGNRDGMDNNNSWNCGTEGSTTDSHILALRERQMKNFCMALLLAKGVPMISMGDEYGRSKNGNNNTWCQDTEQNWFLWNELCKCQSLHRFWKELIAFRQSHAAIRKDRFLTRDDIAWHGTSPYIPDWSEASRFVAYTLMDKDNDEYLYVAFNAGFTPVQVWLPEPPKGKVWVRIVNTGLLPPQDVCSALSRQQVMKSIKLVPYSSCLFEAIATDAPVFSCKVEN